MLPPTNLPEIEFDQTTRRLGLLLPDTYPARLPNITTAPGFQVWTPDQIAQAIREKPVKKRQYFTGTEWIMDQGSLGSCNPCAESGALRRTMRLSGRNDVPKLSWEFAYAQLVDGNDVGSMLADAREEGGKLGMPVLNLQKHPLNRDFRKRDYTQDEYNEALAWRFEKAYAVNSPEELATAVLSGQGAAVVAVHVGNRFTSLDRNGICGVDNGPGNHAVCVDDAEMINGNLVFDMPNSWGLNFGEAGRGYLTWNHFVQTRPYHEFYVVLASSNPGF
jgi:hypothetical protein